MSTTSRIARFHPVLAAALGLALACADGDEPPDCDSDTELRITYGSDIAGVDDSTTCEALPDGCEEDPSCECLIGQQVEGIHLDFCLEQGSCENDDGLLLVVCPGG
jgi:hypothetical protein